MKNIYLSPLLETDRPNQQVYNYDYNIEREFEYTHLGTGIKLKRLIPYLIDKLRQDKLEWIKIIRDVVALVGWEESNAIIVVKGIMMLKHSYQRRLCHTRRHGLRTY